MKKNKELLAVLIIILLALPTIFPLLKPGFFSMHDDTQVPRILLMARSLSDGMFPVRWVEDLGYGYGYPIFNFYAPLVYYVGAILTLVSGNALVATKLVFISVLIGAGISMYFFARKFFGIVPALVAGFVYVYFPYHAINAYVRGALSELGAYVLLPLFWLAFYSLYYTKQKTLTKNLGHILLLGISLACIITSHNLSAYMLLLFTVLFGGIGLFIRTEKQRFVTALLLGIALGLFLSAFYWLPAITEMRFTDVASQVGGGSDFRDHFLCLTQFWQTNWGYTGSVPGCVDGMSFTLGKSTLLLLPFIFVTLLYTTWKGKLRQNFLILTAGLGLLLSFFLMLPLSRGIWEVIPGMGYLQFPWRFFNFFSLFFAVFLASFLWVLEKYAARISLILSAGVVLFTIALYAKLFMPQQIFPRDIAFYTNRNYIAYEVTKRSDEYLPASFVPLHSAEEIPQHWLVGNSSLTVKEIDNRTGHYKATFSATQKSNVLLTIAYFPAWHVLIDKQEVPLTIEKRGFSVQVPAGDHTLQAVFRQTPVEIIGNTLTCLGLLSIILGIIRPLRYVRKKTT